MSDGKCGRHTYDRICEPKMQTILEELKKGGAEVTGNNPWDVKLNQHGIVLQGTWDAQACTLSIIVLEKDWYVPCGKIWSEINMLISHIQGVSETEIAMAYHKLAGGN